MIHAPLTHCTGDLERALALKTPEHLTNYTSEINIEPLLHLTYCKSVLGCTATGCWYNPMFVVFRFY